MELEAKKLNEAQRELVNQYYPLAYRMSAKFCFNTNIPEYYFDELRSAAVLGLIQAALTFESRYKIPFNKYASFKIKCSIIDSIRKLRNRTAREGVGRSATNSSIEHAHDVECFRDFIGNFGLDLLGDSVTIENLVYSQGDSPETYYEKNELCQILNRIIKSLPETNQEVIRNKYYDQNYSNDSVLNSRSAATISRLHTSSLDYIKDELRYYSSASN